VPFSGGVHAAIVGSPALIGGYSRQRVQGDTLAGDGVDLPLWNPARLSTCVNCRAWRAVGEKTFSRLHYRDNILSSSMLQDVFTVKWHVAATGAAARWRGCHRWAAVGLQIGIVTTVTYQYTIAVIALSLLISPFWIQAARRLSRISHLA